MNITHINLKLLIKHKKNSIPHKNYLKKNTFNKQKKTHIYAQQQN